MAYQGNSNNEKKDIQSLKLQPVGGATIKETKSQQFKNDMSLIFTNIIKPNLLSFVGASLHSAIDQILFKNRQNGAPPGYYNGYSSGVINYSSFSSTNLQNQIKPIQPQQTKDYKSIGWVSKDKADRALNDMRAVIREYGRVSINNLFDLAELSGPGKEGWNYGWYNLDTASTTMVNGGWWVIVLPEPVRFPN